MHLEAVIVSVNYGDFLAQTLPHNKGLFSKIVVVTDKKDKMTEHICRYYGVECVQTDAFYHEGAHINKAAGIEEGLKRLTRQDWVVQMDADIYLPPQARTILEFANKHGKLDQDCIYGIDRFKCVGWEKWIEFLAFPKKIYDQYFFINLDVFPLYTRVSQYYGEGHYPIGFFQLWHPGKSNRHNYPKDGVGADRTDMVFCKQWEACKRRFLPELVAIHLESEEAPMGANWFGRKTKYFGPEGYDEVIRKLLHLPPWPNDY